MFRLSPAAADKELRSKIKEPVLEKGLDMPIQERPKIRAPELTGHRGWLNTDKPLSLAALKGKVVLLDFWTYGCINCMHIIPDLKKLEKKYPNELVVIGVHSAKFENEKDTENIRRIILRYEIEHPIVAPAALTSRAHGIDRRFAGPVTVGVRMEHRLQDRLQVAPDDCAMRSATVGMPSGRVPPFAFGISIRRTGGGK